MVSAVGSLGAVSWWAWTLLWLVLVAAAGLVVYGLVRRLIRRGVALAHELGEAADRLAEVSRALEAVSGDPAAAEPAPTPERRRHAPSRAASRGHR